MNKKKIALALEGGGARGSYEIGVVKALIDMGYEIQAVVGTSIGAINGAMIAAGKVDSLEHFWLNTDIEDAIVDGEKVEKVLNFDIDMNTIKFIIDSLLQNGIDVTPVKKILEKEIDEDALRKSGAVFGLTTVAFKDMKFEALRLFLEDIPRGQLIDYIMASANFPGFKPLKIDGAYMLDGGFDDNLPVNMLLDRGYKNIVAVKLNNVSKKRAVEEKHLKYITYIKPKINLGRTLIVDSDKAKTNIKAGYEDTKKIMEVTQFWSGDHKNE